MLSDLAVLDLLQNLYDGTPDTFDHSETTQGCSWAFKSNPDEDIIAFEGSHNIPDWLRDFEGEMVFIEGLGGVHLGFYTPLPAVLNLVLGLTSPEKPKKIVGHSLGGGEAQIFTAMLDRAGYSVMETVTFGCPIAGDSTLAGYLAPYPNRSYWNYHDPLHHDPVGDVAFHIPIVAPYVVPRQRILVDVAPLWGDQWGDLLGWHHLTPNYRQGLINIGVN